MSNFTARFHVDVDNDYEKVHKLFLYNSVSIAYYHSFVPPNRVVYTIGPLTEVGVKNWEQKFKDLGVNYKLTVADYEKVKALIDEYNTKAE